MEFLSGTVILTGDVKTVIPGDLGLSQKFRQGVGGRGLATSRAQNTAKKCPQNGVPLLIWGDMKKGPEKRP